MAKLKRKTLSEAAAEVQQAGETAGRQDSEPVSRDAGKKTGRPVREDEPVKVTVYLDPDANDALEEAWFRLRRKTGRKLSKSALASAALRLATQDLDALLGQIREG